MSLATATAQVKELQEMLAMVEDGRADEVRERLGWEVDTGDITCSADDLTLEAIEYLWAPFIPQGKLVILAGSPKDGKSTLALTICATLSDGRSLPCEDSDREPQTVVYFTAEDGLRDTMLPRAMAAGANLRNVRFGKLTYSEWGKNKKKIDKTVSLKNTELLRELLEKHHPTILVIDPLQAFIGADVDLNKANSVRPVLAAIAELAEEFKTTVLLIAHLTKNADARGANRVLGSVDFVGAARCVLMSARDPQSKDRFLCVQYATYGADGQAILYRIESAKPIPIPGTSKFANPAQIVFGNEIIERSYEEIIKRDEDNSEGVNLKDRTKAIIRSALTKPGLFVESKKLQAKAKVSRSTWNAAIKALEAEGFVVEYRPVKDDRGQVLRWEMALSFALDDPEEPMPEPEPEYQF